jgi:hypothetical protein
MFQALMLHYGKNNPTKVLLYSRLRYLLPLWELFDFYLGHTVATNRTRINAFSHFFVLIFWSGRKAGCTMAPRLIIICIRYCCWHGEMNVSATINNKLERITNIFFQPRNSLLAYMRLSIYIRPSKCGEVPGQG